MKTALDWYTKEYFNVSDLTFSDFKNTVEQIQLDAWKQGMLDAIVIVKDFKPSNESFIVDEIYRVTNNKIKI